MPIRCKRPKSPQHKERAVAHWFRVASLLLLSCSYATIALALHRYIKRTPDNRVADAVLKNLLSSPLGRTLPKIHYRVALWDEGTANAYSYRNGTIVITTGLFPVFESDRGVWAAVIGHELGHILLAHPNRVVEFQAALRQAYARAHVTRGEPALQARESFRSTQRIFRLKGDRQQEYQADFIGMMLMAEAGYQPGYCLILEQRLLYGLGNQPRIEAIFSHHPSMELREKHIRKFYGAAMDIFRSRWPDAAKSPGGNLPPYGEIGPWTIRQVGEARGGGRLVFNVPVQFRRAAGMKVRVAAFFLEHQRRVPAALAQYRASDGSLVLNGFLNGSANGSGRVSLETPVRALATQHRKLEAVVFLMADGRPLAVSHQPFEIAHSAGQPASKHSPK